MYPNESIEVKNRDYSAPFDRSSLLHSQHLQLLIYSRPFQIEERRERGKGRGKEEQKGTACELQQ